jgi:anhydro-N-acetylmuramic acid kinase
MRMLSERLGSAKVLRGSDLGWSGDAIEAQAFAYLAVRSLKGLPLTYPGTTGISESLTGGVLAKP